MKLFILFFIIAISFNLYSYKFSEILPQNTIFYFSVEDFNGISNNLDKQPKSTFLESKEFKVIESNLKKIFSIMVYEEEEDMTKIDALYMNLKKLMFNSFAFTVGFDKLFRVEYSLLIEGKDSIKYFEILYKEFLADKLKSGEVLLKKEMIKNIKINILEIKDNKTALNTQNRKSQPKENTKIVYALVNDQLVITSSSNYMEILISTIKNKNIPKLSENLIFKKDKMKHLKSEFYMFLDLKSIMKFLSLKKETKEVIDNLSLNKLDSIISYIEFSDQKTYTFFTKIVATGSLPDIIKKSFFDNETINIPEFIPDGCYSFNAISINFMEIFNTANKFNTQKELKKMKSMEASMGVTFKDFINGFGKELYYLNFLKNNKKSNIFLFSMANPKYILDLIRGLGRNPIIGLNESDYLDGKLFTASGNFNLIGYALGYKNNNFMAGNIEVVKEIMQKMSGNGGTFYNNPFYKKLISVMGKEHAIISFTDNAVSLYSEAQDFKKNFDKEYGKVSTKKAMKVVTLAKKIVNLFAGMEMEKFKKYFNYSLLKVYIEENEFTLEFKDIK
jgi:hypothetical protein